MSLPYKPTKEEWREVFDMLCGHCSNLLSGCDIVDGMIDMKDGGDWPTGGWVNDAGAGVSCLSYKTAAMETLNDSELQAHISNAVPMCDGCAARKGTEASISRHTRIDFREAVNRKALFTCHKECNFGKPCGGWANAVSAQLIEERQASDD